MLVERVVIDDRMISAQTISNAYGVSLAKARKMLYEVQDESIKQKLLKYKIQNSCLMSVTIKLYGAPKKDIIEISNRIDAINEVKKH